MIDHQTVVNLVSAFSLWAFVAGAGFGLAGYTSARRKAYNDFVAAHQRQVREDAEFFGTTSAVNDPDFGEGRQ